LSVLYASFKD